MGASELATGVPRRTFFVLMRYAFLRVWQRRNVEERAVDGREVLDPGDVAACGAGCAGSWSNGPGRALHRGVAPPCARPGAVLQGTPFGAGLEGERSRW